jgi:hypothetical protein
MTRYAVPPDINLKTFRICAYGSIGLMLLFLVLSRSEWLELNDRASHVMGWAAVGLLVLGLVGIWVLMVKDSLNKAWQKVTFDLADDKITRISEGAQPIELPLSEINFLGESRSGIVVRGGDPSKGFFIPRAVNEFEALKQQLSRRCRVTPVETKTYLKPLLLPSVLTVALYTILFTSRTTILVSAAGVLALLFQGWVIFTMRKMLAETRSHRLVMSAFVFSWLILLWIVYQRVSSTL